MFRRTKVVNLQQLRYFAEEDCQSPKQLIIFLLIDTLEQDCQLANFVRRIIPTGPSDFNIVPPHSTVTGLSRFNIFSPSTTVNLRNLQRSGGFKIVSLDKAASLQQLRVVPGLDLPQRARFDGPRSAFSEPEPPPTARGGEGAAEAGSCDQPKERPRKRGRVAEPNASVSGGPDSRTKLEISTARSGPLHRRVVVT